MSHVPWSLCERLHGEFTCSYEEVLKCVQRQKLFVMEETNYITGVIQYIWVCFEENLLTLCQNLPQYQLTPRFADACHCYIINNVHLMSDI